MAQLAIQSLIKIVHFSEINLFYIKLIFVNVVNHQTNINV